MAKEYIPRRSQHVRQKHTISFDDRLWKRLQEVANQHYEGDKSRALEGLLLYDWMVEITKRKSGKRHEHWISAPLVLRTGELEPLLERLEAGDSDFVGAFIDVRLDERARDLQPAPEPPPQLPGF